MSQEQEMRFEEIQHEQPKSTFEEGQRDEPKQAFKEEIFGYRSYASEVAGQKIQEVSEQKSPSHNQRLILAVLSLGMLMFVSLTAMFIFARMGATPAFGPGHSGFVDPREGDMVAISEHGYRMARYYSMMNNGSGLVSWLLLVPMCLFFIATIAVNMLFNRGSK